MADNQAFEEDEEPQPVTLPTGYELKNKYRIVEKIGSGAFGRIYRATNIQNATDVAIKIEPKTEDSRRMVQEAIILIELSGKSHIPTMLNSGGHDNFNFIVMKLVGRNLSGVRRNSPLHRLSLSTTLRSFYQVVSGIEVIHTAGYVHRDIKPSNFCIGLDTTEKQTIFIIDYGLARRYVEKGTMRPRPERERVGFRGTPRYASLRAHDRKDQGRADDLMSIWYSFIELGQGALPWRKERDSKVVSDMKRAYLPRELPSKQPWCMVWIGDLVLQLGFTEKPRYDKMHDWLHTAVVGRDQKNEERWVKEPYDWQCNYITAYNEKRVQRVDGVPEIDQCWSPNPVRVDKQKDDANDTTDAAEAK